MGISERPALESATGEGLEIRILGCLEVLRGGRQQVIPASRKARGLLAYLALTAHPHRREELCDLFWEDVSDPRGELRWCLTRLRAVLGPWLVSSQEGISIARQDLTIDAAAFRRLAATVCSERETREALTLWRGRPLANTEISASLRFHAWWVAEQESLIEFHRQVLHRLVDQLWPAPDAALAAARQLVAQYPFDEWGHARVSQALDRVGRGAQGRTYADAARQALSRQLDLPAASIMTELPAVPCAPASPRHANLMQASGIKHPLLGVFPIEVPSDDENLKAMANHMTAQLAGGLWRSGVCDITQPDGRTTLDQARPIPLTYAVRGSLVRLDGAMKLSLRCETLQNGTVLWFCQFDAGRSAPARIAGWLGRTVGAIHSSIQIAEINRAKQGERPAYDLLLEAQALSGVLEPDANRQALTLLRMLLEEMPNDPRALALAAWCHAQRSVYNWTENAAGDRSEADQFVTAATVKSANDPNNLTILATARCLVGDLAGASILLCRSLQISPNSSWTHSRTGWLAVYLDQPDRAIRSFRTAMQLAPLDPATFNSMIGLGVAHFLKGQLRPAIIWMERGLTLNPRAMWTYRNLVPAYLAAGRRTDAERGVRAMLSAHPSLNVAAVANAMVFSRVTMERITHGLYQSGLPKS